MSTKKPNSQEPDVSASPQGSETDEYAVRCAKAEQMRAAGIEPWPMARAVNATASESC